MMMDFELFARRSFDALDEERRDAIRVWGDALQTTGDPRGVLIALEYGLRDRPDLRREILREMNSHLHANGKPLLGDLAELLVQPRGIELDWRSGLLHGAFVDLRHLPSEPSVIDRLLAAPAAPTLRRLHVRVRRARDVRDVLRRLADRPTVGPLLEEIIIQSGVRATRLGSSFVANARPIDASLGAPLRFLILEGTIVSLHIDQHQSLSSARPAAADARLLLGRALTCNQADLRVAAIERVTRLGPAAFMFVDTLLALLEPGMPVPQAKVVHALREIGYEARRALPLLALITGRAAHYNVETRKAAGLAIAALRA